MSRDPAELLVAPTRGAMLPAAILARAEDLARGLPDPADERDPAAALARLRRRLPWCLGLDRIPRVAPHWTPVRELPGDGYTIEVGHYEAVPGLVVPAHLYRPDGAGPHPAAVHPPGHWMENARLEPDVQRTNAWLARSGVAVLCYDPIGQGERRRGWHTHGQLAPLPAGFTSLGLMVVETIAALDLLAARSDVDPTRLAVVGASGGGLVATFTAAIDERVAAAAICCILNTHRSQLADGAFGTGWDGFTDLCNQVPRLAATANMGHVLAAIAPRDVTVVHAIDDPPFPIAGARAVVGEAARSYAALGAPAALRLVEVSGGHGWHAAMRETAVAALARALGLSAPSGERELDLLERAFAITHEVARAHRPQSTGRPTGRLPGEALPADVDTNPIVVGLARAVATTLRDGRAPDRADLIDSLGGLPEPRPTGRIANHVPLPDGGFGQRIEIVCAPGIALDGVLLMPDGFPDDPPAVLVTVDEGGKAIALAGPVATLARRRGLAVLAADLRGTGESAASEFELASASFLLDRDLLAARVDDLRAWVRVVSERYSTGQQVDKGRILVHGDGPFALVALLAAALDDDIAGAVGTGFVTSLEDLLAESPDLTPMAFPFRALETYDVADLVRLCAPRPALVGRVGDDGEALADELLEAVLR